MSINSYVRFMLLLISIGFTGSTLSHGIGSSFIESLITADFIFKGEVIDVSYRNSTPLHPRNPALAHTFVTYRIDHVFKGRLAADPTTGGREDPTEEPETITLRFLGGSAGNDEYEIVYGTPLFDVGDIDVLMVSDNGQSICPLVPCLQGRYRIIERYVYGDDGQEVVETSVAAVRYGKFHHLRDVIVNQIGEAEIVRVGEVELNETGLPEPLPDFGIHHDVDSFANAIIHELEELEASGILLPTDPVNSQDISVAFSVDLAKPVERLPTVEEENNPPDLGFLLSDRIENWLLKRNNGDPILSERESAWLNLFRTRELKILNRKELRQIRSSRRSFGLRHRGGRI